MEYSLKFNNTTAANVVVDLVSRANEDVPFDIEETFSFPVDPVAGPLEMSDGIMSIAAYGLMKLIQDRTSSLTKKALSEMGLEGREAQLERVKGFKEVYELFESGKWNVRKPSAKKDSISNYLVEAIAELKGITSLQARAALQGLTKEQREPMAELPQVKAIIDRLKAEAKEASANGENLLADLL